MIRNEELTGPAVHSTPSEGHRPFHELSGWTVPLRVVVDGSVRKVSQFFASAAPRIGDAELDQKTFSDSSRDPKQTVENGVRLRSADRTGSCESKISHPLMTRNKGDAS